MRDRLIKACVLLLGPIFAIAAERSYTLYQTIDGTVLRIITIQDVIQKDEPVKILSNPYWEPIPHGNYQVMIPITPNDPVWITPPDGKYKLPSGFTYVIENGKIVHVLDKNGMERKKPQPVK